MREIHSVIQKTFSETYAPGVEPDEATTMFLSPPKNIQFQRNVTTNCQYSVMEAVIEVHLEKRGSKKKEHHRFL